jgi:hypothetical protein
VSPDNRRHHELLVSRDLFLPVRRDRQGRTGPTPKGARGPLWRSAGRGDYVPARVERTIDQRILEAAAVLPRYGGVTGWASLRWQRARWFEGLRDGVVERPVTLVTAGTHIRPQPGIAVSTERLSPSDLISVDTVPCTSAVRSTWFEMRYAASPRDAAVTLSMAAYSDLVSIAELADYAYEHPGWTGAPMCRGAIPLAFENAWSPREVDVAIVWVLLADLPRPLLNHPIFDRAGRHLGTPDMVDPEAGVIVQYDGPDHLKLARRANDVLGEERYRTHGLECVTVLAPHLHDKSALAERFVRARARARSEAESTRSWTVELPAWWVPTHSVALRRALTDRDRQRLLRYRLAA